VQALVLAKFGVEGDRQRSVLAGCDRVTVDLGEISASGPCSAIHGARMKMPRIGGPSIPVGTSASKLAVSSANHAKLSDVARTATGFAQRAVLSVLSITLAKGRSGRVLEGWDLMRAGRVFHHGRWLRSKSMPQEVQGCEKGVATSPTCPAS
jgi:hypothetical protein